VATASVLSMLPVTWLITAWARARREATAALPTSFSAALALCIAAERLATDGKGESQPAEPNTTPQGKANNRRVEFIRR
jgi:flagellar motor protein MotB